MPCSVTLPLPTQIRYLIILRKIALESNVLTIIGASSLTGLTSITTLNLQNNRIASIEAGAFGGLIALQVVSVATA